MSTLRGRSKEKGGDSGLGKSRKEGFVERNVDYRLGNTEQLVLAKEVSPSKENRGGKGVKRM